MADVRLNGKIELNLPSHISAEIHLAKSLGLVGEMQDHRAGELVVGCPSAVGSLEYVDAVPFTGLFSAGRCSCFAVAD
jgi:hypothetical protein